jgi:hypothetical protein
MPPGAAPPSGSPVQMPRRQLSRPRRGLRDRTHGGGPYEPRSTPSPRGAGTGVPGSFCYQWMERSTKS